MSGAPDPSDTPDREGQPPVPIASSASPGDAVVPELERQGIRLSEIRNRSIAEGVRHLRSMQAQLRAAEQEVQAMQRAGGVHETPDAHRSHRAHWAHDKTRGTP